MKKWIYSTYKHNTYIYMHTRMYTIPHIYTRTHINIYSNNTVIPTNVHAYTHAHTYTYTCTHKHQIHTHSYIYIYSYTHKHICKNTHTGLYELCRFIRKFHMT